MFLQLSAIIGPAKATLDEAVDTTFGPRRGPLLQRPDGHLPREPW